MCEALCEMHTSDVVGIDTKVFQNRRMGGKLLKLILT